MSPLAEDVLALAPDIRAAVSLIQSRRDEVAATFVEDLFDLAQKLADRPENILFVLSTGAEAARLLNDLRRYLRLLKTIGGTAADQGNLDLAVSSLQRARVAAQNAFLNGDVAILGELIDAASRHAVMAKRAGRLADSVDLLTGLRAILRERGFRRAAVWIELTLADAHRELKDLATARHYLHFVRTAVTHQIPPSAGDVRLPEAADVAGFAIRLAARFYYDARDIDATEDLAAYVVSVLPEETDAWFLLGNIQVQKRRFEDALATWGRYLALRPDSVAGHRNRALALSGMGRVVEAIAGLDRAIELEPNDPGLYYNRGARLDTIERYEEAIRDYERAIELFADSRYDAGDGEVPFNWDSEHHTPVLYRIVQIEDLIFKASLNLGDHTRARRRIEALIAERHDMFRFLGHMLASVLYKEEHRVDEELEELARALVIGDVPDLRRRRAEILIGRGQLDSAVEDIVRLAAAAEHRDNALEVMQAAAAEHPDDPAIQKWLGYVLLKSARREADAALTKAIEANPDDPDLWLWRGQARTIASYVDEDPLESGVDLRRMLEGLFDLSKAIHTDGPHAAEALRIYKWIFDHLCFNHGVRSRMFLFGLLGGEDGPFLTVEDLGRGFLNLNDGQQLAVEGKWRESIPDFERALQIFRDLDLPGLAAQTAVRLADVCLRLNELDRAAHLLETAEDLNAVAMVPLSGNLQQAVPGFRSAILSQSGGKRAYLYEVEYLPLYALGQDVFRALMKIHRCELRRRRGDIKGALEARGERENVLKTIERFAAQSDEPAVNAYRLLYSVFALYRDAEMLDEAEALLPALERYAGADDKESLLNGMGTLRLKKRNYAGAEEMFLRAKDEHGSRPEWKAACDLNLAFARLLLGRPAEALQLADSVDRNLLNGADLIGYWYMNAKIHQALGDFDQARGAIDMAFEEFERVRNTLDLRARMSWQERFSFLYETAVDFALTRGDAALAFDLAENARARALADHLSAGLADADSAMGNLTAREASLRVRRDRLSRLRDQIAGEDIDPALVREVVEAEARDSRLIESRIPPRIDAERLEDDLHSLDHGIETARAELEARRTQHAGAVAAETLSFREAAALLEP